MSQSDTPTANIDDDNFVDDEVVIGDDDWSIPSRRSPPREDGHVPSDEIPNEIPNEMMVMTLPNKQSAYFTELSIIYMLVTAVIIILLLLLTMYYFIPDFYPIDYQINI